MSPSILIGKEPRLMEATTPRPAEVRRFGLLDLMILVGSVAAGFAAFRAVGSPPTDWGELLRSLVLQL